jgi:glutaredoxin
VHVILYTRQGCHLCDDAWTVLDEASQRYGFSVETVDVDSDVELVQKFGQCVPVVTVDGKLRFRGRVNRVLLERLLRALSVRA